MVTQGRDARPRTESDGHNSNSGTSLWLHGGRADDVAALGVGVASGAGGQHAPAADRRTLAGGADAVRGDEPAHGGADLADEAAAIWTRGRLYVPGVVDQAESTRSSLDVPIAGDPVAERRDLIAAFQRGYRGAGGDPNYESHIVEDVIPCEYGWESYVPKNAYMSRAQFDPGSWESAGGGDPADDYTVGRNVANWIALIDDPGSSSGWPYCWNRGGW